MKRFVPLLAAAAVGALLASPLAVATIAQWSFNNDTTNPKPPTSGAGSLSTQGGMTFLTALTSDNTGSPGDATPLSPLGWNHSQAMNNTATPATAAAGAAFSGSVGLKATASTVGYGNIRVSWHQAQGFRGSRYYQLFATSDGTTFVPVSGGVGAVAANLGGTPGNPWYSSLSIDNNGLVDVRVNDGKILNATGESMGYELSYAFAPGSAYENNPNFAVVLAAVYPAGGNDYVSSFAGSTNPADATKGYLRNGTSTGGGLRYDLITVAGTAIPEPGSLALLVVACLGCGGRRRRRRDRAVATN